MGDDTGPENGRAACRGRIQIHIFFVCKNLTKILKFARCPALKLTDSD